MPNPNPNQTEEFKKHRFKPKAPVYSDNPLADKPTQVRLAQDITAAIDGLGEKKPGWLRRVITNAAKAELMGESPAPGAESPAVNQGAKPSPAGDSGEPSPAGEQINTVALLELIDQAVSMTKAKEIKILLLKLKERLTP